MDLGICPKCGESWIAGDERCRQCGFTAIGAGLAALPKKKKRRVRRYVEPGGSAPMLSFTLVAILAGGGYYYKPWAEDWEMVRSILGNGRVHSLKGKWDVVETLQYKDPQKNVFNKTDVAKGVLSFDGTDNVKLTITAGSATTEAKGHYLVDGLKVKLFNLAPVGQASVSVPKTMSLGLAWTGPDDVLASITQNDVLYLRREHNNNIAKLIHMCLTKNAVDAPANVRGLISKLQEQLSRGSA